MARKKSSQKKKQAKGMVTNRVAGVYCNPGSKPVIMKNQAPRMSNTTGGGLRVKNTEYYADVFSKDTGSFAIHTFSPTNLSWLGNIARSYQRYRVHAMTFSYVTQVATTQAGSVDMGLFYDAEDAILWFTGGGADTLYPCAQYATGPVYAGGAINTSQQRVVDDNWFGLHVDALSVHRAYNWLTVDSSAATNETANLSRAVTLAFRSNAPGISTATKVGRVIVSYDIEFIQPVSYINQAFRVADIPDSRVFPPIPEPTPPPDVQ